MKVPQIKIRSNSETHISRFVHGLWRLHQDPLGVTPKRILEKIEACLLLGINTFDHADIYGGYENEEIFGRALAQNPSLKASIKIVSKCGIQIPTEKYKTKYYDLSPLHIRKSVEGSLKKLGVDCLDLLLIHRPDPLLDPVEVSDAFLQLHVEGKVKAFGVSNFSASQFSLLQNKLHFPIVTNQVEFNPFHTEPLFDGTFDQAIDKEFSPMVWSPTAGGSIFNSKSKPNVTLLGALNELGKKYSCSADQVLYSWFLLHPAKLIPVLGSNDIKHIQSAVGALEIQITKEDWFRILEVGRGKEVA
jgi:predicted oxidoreductase